MKALLYREFYFLKKLLLYFAILASLGISGYLLPLFIINEDLHDILYVLPAIICMANAYVCIAVDRKCFLASAIAPTKRSALVNVKYICLCLNIAVSVLLALIFSFIGAWSFGTNIGAFEILKRELLNLSLAVLLLLIIFPFIFKFGMSASLLIPFAIGIATGTITIMGLEMLDLVFSDILILGVVCVIALLVSYFISLLIYKRRNIK